MTSLRSPIEGVMLPICELFYSLQGEGAQTGMAAIFVRLSGCNLRCSYCDTDFEQATLKNLEEIAKEISYFPTRELIWTGGEPTLLLTEEIIASFRHKGYRQSIETNGTRPVPKGIDYIACSPKPEAFSLLEKNFPNGVSEWRFPFGEGILRPPSVTCLPPATHYFLSPVFDPLKAISEQQKALEACIEYVLEHPQWQLSVQLHKLAGFR